MQIDEKSFNMLPERFKAMFRKLPNPGSDEVLEAFGRFGERRSSEPRVEPKKYSTSYEGWGIGQQKGSGYGDSGTAARFFPALGFGEDELRFHYSAKANKKDRAGSKHPTVKPQSLLKWLCRLITPPGGTILDPFAGSGSTGQAALAEGFRATLVEREEEYFADCIRRMEAACPQPDLLAGTAA